jgi:hypothetical protein
MSDKRHGNFMRSQSEQQKSGKVFEVERAYNKNTEHVECKTKLIPAVIRATENI